MDLYAMANKMRCEHLTINDLPIRVTFYARVSTHSEEQALSIEHQVEHFLEMIQNNKNWTYVEGYIDRTRGEKAENRLRFMEMIKDAQDGKFDLVITKEVSRFARNTIDSLTYTRELLHAGVGVLFQNDSICTIDTDSELRLTIMSSIAADEVRKLSERIKFGHKRSIENGTVFGNSRIFGYTKKDGKLVIDEKEAEMVRLIFEEYSTGTVSTRKLEKLLFSKGYRNRNGKTISHTTITNIIQNPKYKGYYCGNKVKIIDCRTKEQRFLPSDEWITYKDTTGNIVPAIVDEDLWDRAFSVYTKRRDEVLSLVHSPKYTSVLSGKIFCSLHQEPYWRTSYSHRLHRGEENVYQWICRVKKRSKSSDCPSFPIYETELYLLMYKFFLKFSQQINEFIGEYMTLIQSTDMQCQTAKRIQKMEDQLAHEQTKRDKIMDLYAEDLISKEDFLQKNESIIAVIHELQESVTAQKSIQLSNTEQQKHFTEIKQYLDSKQLEYMNEEAVDRDFIDRLSARLVDRIEVEPVNENEMNVHISLNIGVTDDESINKHRRSSGNIVKKMMPEQRIKIEDLDTCRATVRKLGHMSQIHYTLYWTQ